MKHTTENITDILSDIKEGLNATSSRHSAEMKHTAVVISTYGSLKCCMFTNFQQL
uniref:Uncharacterized protein n=1 Tax=Arundo donax TaxID=35708 RepID=A0A0A8YFA0_ARUDO